jgi:hypothetical protein
MEFEPYNVKLLCYACHIHWWHKHPIEAGDWYKEKFPDRYKYLRKLGQNTNLPPFNYEAVLSDLKAKLERLK